MGRQRLGNLGLSQSRCIHYELSSRAKARDLGVHGGDTVARARTLIPRFARDDNCVCVDARAEEKSGS